MEALSQREFDTWRETDNEFKGEMRAFIAAQVALNLASEKRLTRTEERLDGGERRTAIITGLVSSIVGAVGGFFGAKV
jgi:hypothetical protein